MHQLGFMSEDHPTKATPAEYARRSGKFHFPGRFHWNIRTARQLEKMGLDESAEAIWGMPRDTHARMA